jgi:signal transduction histidine kinase
VRAGPAGTAGFWIDERSGIGWAAAPAGTSGGDARGAAVVWAALPPPRGDPWLLGLLAGLLLLAHVAGAALGARAGREIRSVAGMLAEAARGGAGDPPAAAPSRFREVARLQEAAADVLARVGEVRSAEGQALREAEESHRLHTQFLATVSHDLKGPLNAVLGFSELLLQGAEGPLMPKQREDVRLIYRAGEELLAVVTAILDTAKIQAGRIELQREWVAPVELVSAAQGHGRSLAGAKEVLVLSEVQAGLAPVLVDRHRLGQALAAVIANAVKFTERGVVRIRAFVDDAPPDLRRRSLRIDVSDQGPGIAERDRSRIFRAFEQIDSTATRSQGGPGLGLFIARAMVESHGGRIWYETEVGRGSTFSIALPLGEEAVPPSA